MSNDYEFNVFTGNLDLVNEDTGSGDVTGPSSAVDENITVFDSTTGKIIKDSGINISAVIANTAKISYTDAADVSLNTTHRTSDGTDHSDVVLANTHRGLTDNPHNVTKTQVGLSNVPNLDTSNASNITTGTLPSSVLPPVALTTVAVYSNEATMLAATTEEGDVAVRSDENKSYMKNSGTAGTMADWTELQTPTDSVLSVNGETGTVILTTGDITEDTDHNYITDAQQVVLGNTSGTNTGDQDLSHTGEVTGTTQSLTLNKIAISNKTDTPITAGDYIIYGDTSDSDNLKKDTVQGILDLVPTPTTYWDRNGTVLSPKTTGDNIETTGSGTFGKGIFDVTDTEALLVRKDGDGGDILVVDTTNARFGFNAVTSHLYSVAISSPQSTNPFDRTGGGFLMRAGKGYSTSTSIGGAGGKFELEGGAGGTANWGLMIKTGGDGGILKLRGGVGGNAEGTGTLRGGNGGKLQLVGGNKGYGATSDGDGGDVEIVSGLGVTHGEINLIIGDFTGTTILTGLSDGSGIQQNDNIKHYWGTGKDASAYYDGTDFILNAQEVGSGHIILNTPKTTTGDPTGVEGKIYWNTVDNVIKMYADGAWRTLASW